MKNIKIAVWGALVLLSALWLLAEQPTVDVPASILALRSAMIQYSGVLAVGCMSLAMILATRPRWPERWLGGLDKMYRLHKWLGIGGLALAIAHWLWAQGFKWAIGFGWLARPERGPRPVMEDGAGQSLEQTLMSLRGTAEGAGEWAFYAVVVLIVIALVRLIPYRFFYLTHRLLAIAYLVLVFHAVVLTSFGYWMTPLGVVMAILLAYGTVAALLVLFNLVGVGRKVDGTISRLHYYPELSVLEGEIDVPQGWPGHKPGQFAFVTSDASEGAHPYTIASDWKPAEHRLTFIVKGLGDHTRRLREKLRVGQKVKVGGPYGSFTFDDVCPRQIWVGGGIGITPFIGRMKELAERSRGASGSLAPQEIDLFHTTADYSDEAIAKLTADAKAANVRLHVLHDARDGLLGGDRIREAVPKWQEGSVWFCGPVGFGRALRRDLAAHGLPVNRRFHQELFAMR
jgi:predicted ferric reductase